MSVWAISPARCFMRSRISLLRWPLCLQGLRYAEPYQHVAQSGRGTVDSRVGNFPATARSWMSAIEITWL